MAEESSDARNLEDPQIASPLQPPPHRNNFIDQPNSAMQMVVSSGVADSGVVLDAAIEELRGGNREEDRGLEKVEKEEEGAERLA